MGLIACVGPGGAQHGHVPALDAWPRVLKGNVLGHRLLDLLVCWDDEDIGPCEEGGVCDTQPSLEFGP